MNPKFCSQCGASLAESGMFCPQCGTRIALPKQAEQPTAQPIPPEPTPRVVAPASEASAFATAPASPVYATETQPTYAPTPKPKKQKNPQKRAFVRSIVTKSITLLLATLLLLCSFLPFFSVDFSMDEDSFNVENIHFSIFDFIRMGFLSLSAKDITEFEAEFGDFEDMLEEELFEFADELDDAERFSALSKQAQKKLESLLKRILMKSLRVKELAPAPSKLLLPLFALVYFLLTIAFLVFSILCFIGVFTRGALGSPRLERVLQGLLCCLPVLCLVLFCHKSYPPFSMLATEMDGSFVFHASTLAVLTFIGMLGLWIWSFLSHILFDRLRFSLKNILLRSFSCVLCILLLAFTASNFLSSDASVLYEDEARRTEVSVSFDKDFFYRFSFDEESLEAMDEFYASNSETIKESLHDTFDYLSWYNRYEIKNGESDWVHFDLMLYLLAAYDLHHAAFVFTWIPVLVFLCICCAAVLLWQNLSYFLGAPYSRLACLLTKIFMGIFALAALILTIVFVALTNLSADFYGLSFYAVKLGAGPILLCIFVCATAFLPAKDYKKETPHGIR